MVSIHKVPVIVHLIIRVISSTFRFKRGTVCHTSLCTGPEKTFVNRCGNNSPTHMRGDHYDLSCSL